MLVYLPEGIHDSFYLSQLTKDQVGTLTLKLKKAVPVEVLSVFQQSFAELYGPRIEREMHGFA